MGRVLVVEDDPALRFIVSEGLRDGDLDVIEAADAGEALRLLETTAGIVLVFSDINMPGSLDGIGLAKAVKAEFPSVKMILTSGRPHIVGDVDFIAKPYILNDLVTTIRSAL